MFAYIWQTVKNLKNTFLTDKMSMNFNIDCSIKKVAIQATKMCGGLQLFASNETQGKPLKWFQN